MSDASCPARCDVAIVGGGFAGVAAARVLARQGLSVVVFELNETPGAAVRVEKLSVDQLALLGSLELLEPFRGTTSVTTRVINIRGRRVIDHAPVEDHAIRYVDMLKVLRTQLPPGVRVVIGRVSAIDNSAGLQTVKLSDGRRTIARLVVVATGHARGLREKLGIERRVVHPVPTVSIAFTLKPQPGGFSFPSLTAYGERTGDGVDYTCIFPLGAAMRVNVFINGAVADPRIVAFKTDPLAALLALQPGLTRWLGRCEAADRADLFVVDLSICDRVVQPGVVLIGDAFRTSCPGVGDGLSCLLCDVARLAPHVREWMKTPGMGVEKIARFYADPIKRSSDDSTHRVALRRRRALLDKTLSNRLRRSLHFARRRLVDRLTGRSPANAAGPKPLQGTGR